MTMTLKLKSFFIGLITFCSIAVAEEKKTKRHHIFS